MKRRIGLIAAAVALVAGCSNTVDVKDHGDGLCKQERERMFLGVTYSRSEHFINCDAD